MNENRDNAMDRWADEGPSITRGGVMWTLGSLALLGFLVFLNVMKG